MLNEVWAFTLCPMVVNFITLKLSPTREKIVLSSKYIQQYLIDLLMFNVNRKFTVFLALNFSLFKLQSI